LKERLGFLEMSDVIEKCMSDIGFLNDPTLQDYIETDKETRTLAEYLVTKY
jgi:1-deoxy-D-xylulose-5-phosphate reductoisomerase